MPRPLLAVAALCLLAPAARADAQKPTFDDDIAPVVRQHCAGCHGTDKQRGGLNLASHALAMTGGAGGAVVVPGDSGKSRLYTMTAHDEEPVMPPSKTKIPDAQLALLKLWIDQGARENSGSKAVVAAKPKVEIGLKGVTRGKPDGPPSMPLAGKLRPEPITRTRRPGAVLALAASPWAPVVAVGGQKQVILYHADTGDLLGVLPFEYGQINSLKFSRNAKFLLAAGGRGGQSGKAVLYNVETGAKVTEVGSAETDAVLAADLSADQTLIAVGTPTKMVRVYAVADGAVVQSIKKHTDWVTAVEFSPDGVLLATGDRAGGVFVWEAATAREFHALRGHTGMVADLSWRADSNVLATASLDGSVRLWEMDNGTQVKTWAAHAGGCEAVRFAPDGRLATTGRDKVTKLWDGNGGALKQFEAFPDIGLRVAVSHDNTKVIGGDWAGGLKVWAAADARVVAALDTNPLPAAEQLAVAGQAVAAAEAVANQAKAAADAAQAQVKQKADAHEAAKAAAAKAAGELAAAQKAVADQTAAVGKVTAQLPLLKAEADKAAAGSIMAAQAKVAAGQKALADAQTALAAAQKQVATLPAQVKAAADAVPRAAAESAATTKAASPTGAAAAKAAAGLSAAQARVERLKAKK